MSEKLESPEEKIEKIISRAESNGFEFRSNSQIDSIQYLAYGRFIVLLTIQKEKENEDDQQIEEKGKFEFHINELFFNHNFAKAFFGTYEVCAHCGKHLQSEDWKKSKCQSCQADINLDENVDENWKFHLPRLILQEGVEEIFNYLLQFIENK